MAKASVTAGLMCASGLPQAIAANTSHHGKRPAGRNDDPAGILRSRLGEQHVCVDAISQEDQNQCSHKFAN
jgi:hypothetical protein